MKLSIILLALVCQTAYAQIPSGELQKIREMQAEKGRQEAKASGAMENSFRTLARLAETPGPRFPSLRGSKAIVNELKVSEEDYSKYKGFLASENTGIFKLLAEPDCRGLGKEETRTCSERRVQIFSFAGGFSFREKQRTTQNAADLILMADILRARGSGIQTILVELGDVPLGDISVNSEPLKYLTSFRPESEIARAAKQFDDLTIGITDGNHLYRTWINAQPERSYALRSIAYSVKGLESVSGKSGDVLVAFRVIRRDENGSLTLVWRELQRQNAPKLISDGRQ